MADYGLTENGFNRMRLPEIRQAILESFKAKLKAAGSEFDVAYRPDTVFGMLIDTFAERETEMWETAELIYNAMYPSTAVGAQLDNAGSFTGAVRQAAQKSQATAVFFGRDGTTVPIGSQIKNKTTQALWQTKSAITISASAISQCLILPKSDVATDYTVTIDGVAHTYNSGSNADLSSIIAGLVGVLSANGRVVVGTGAGVEITHSGGGMSIVLSPSLTFAEIGTAARVEPISVIDDAASAGDLNTIITMIDGLFRVENLSRNMGGHKNETDADFRVRYEMGVYRTGAGTQPTIAANLIENVEDVSYVKVLENPSDAVVDEMLPHSILCVVDGGDDAAVAAAIHRYKGAGIDTNGNTEKQVPTDYGVQTIRFSRPENIYVWVKVVITKQVPDEGIFPDGGEDTIKENIMQQLGKLGAGEDVVYQSIYKSIYAVAGVESAEIKLYSNSNATVAPNPSDYQSHNIAIGLDQRAVFDVTRIEVV